MSYKELAQSLFDQIVGYPASEQVAIIDTLTNKIIQNQELRIKSMEDKVTEEKSALTALKSKLSF